MKKFLNASVSRFLIITVIAMLTGCSGSTDGNSGQQAVNTGDNTSNSGGDTSNSPGTGTGNTDSGGTSGDGSSGGGTDGGTGGGSGGGGSSPGTFGTLASLYTAQNERLNAHNCNMLANGSLVFAQSVFRLIGQAGNDVNAVVTLTPDSQFLAQFDQIIITLQGAFTSQANVEGSYSAVATLNGQLVDRTQGSLIISLMSDTVLLINFTEDSNLQSCHLSGAMYLDETTDTGNGGGDSGSGSGSTGGGTGGSGGDTGGGTSGDGTGGTGTVTAGMVVANGQFGSLQMQSAEFPADNGAFEMTTVLFVNMQGNEMFAWTNEQQTTVNIYMGLDNSNTTLNSVNNQEYLCDCFPTVDLVNNQVFFNNVVLYKTTSPTGSMIVNGTLTFPQAN
ncbi:MAG: hypothetical protein L0Z73_14485 [Gammaproteobacteria bacterium]|nr:hypothetical protein [Gammaproteobacteria bacterium]